MLISPTSQLSSQSQSQLSMQTIDDFFNLDSVTTDSATDLFFNPSSSSTPPSLFLPSTPPPPTNLSSIDSLDHSNYHDLYRAWFRPELKDTTPPIQSQPQQPGIFNFADLLAASTDGLFTPPSSSGMPSPDLQLAIDPQLVATPAPHPSSTLSPAVVSPATTAAAAPPTDPSVTGDDEDEDDSEVDEDNDDGFNLSDKVKAAAARVKKVTLGGPAAGIVKRSGGTSCVVRDPDSNDPDDWRPSPEEYKKLSSKEKRQLRNKISARNFRVRRKEYITTLESHIADRDRLIEVIREELGASKLENAELRQEIDALKKAMMEGRASYPVGLPPPSASVTPSASATAIKKRGASSTPLAKANVNKDVASAAPRSGRPFWGGAPILGGGGITPVHATLIPDITFPASASVTSVLTGKSLSPPFAPPAAQENINPHLNIIHPPTPPQSPPTTAPSQPFNAFSDLNPFTIKSLDAYRLQLWTKMAAAGHLHPGSTPPSQLTQPQNLFNTWQQQQQSSSLATSLRPAFFTSTTPSNNLAKSTSSPTLSALLAGKGTVASSSGSLYYPSSQDTRSSVPQIPTSSQAAQAQATAFVAALASQSLMSRLGNAFWDAFTGGVSSPSTPGSGVKNWDADKVRRVLEGRAVVKVVDLDEPTPISSSTAVHAVAGLEDKMKTISISDCNKEGPDREFCGGASTACSVFGNLRAVRDTTAPVHQSKLTEAT